MFNLGELPLHEWKGGEMPIPFGTLVVVKHRDGECFIEPAGTYYSEDWSHEDQNDDIVAYGVVTNISVGGPHG